MALQQGTTPATQSTPPPVAGTAAPPLFDAPPVEKKFDFGNHRLSDVSKTRGIVALIYGDAGVGKTTLLAGFPPDRTQIYDVDGGAGVLLERGWNGSVEVAPENLVGLKEWVEWVSTTKHRFTTIVLDSATNLERRMVFLIGDKRKKEFVDVKEYGDASSKMRSYILALRDLSSKGINVVFIAHAKSDVKGREGVIFPFLSDKLAIELPGLVDICGYMGINPDGTRYLQFAPAPNLRSKTRYGCVQPYEELNLAAIFGRIYADRKARMEATTDPKIDQKSGAEAGVVPAAGAAQISK